jgi:hypothetical protein
MPVIRYQYDRQRRHLAVGHNSDRETSANDQERKRRDKFAATTAHAEGVVHLRVDQSDDLKKLEQLAFGLVIDHRLCRL